MKKMNYFFAILSLIILIIGCQNSNDIALNSPIKEKTSLQLDLDQANRLANLPLNCIQTEYPNKTGVVVAKAEDIASPQSYHPAFYGCFDWHSAVHGHWSLVRLLKAFPNLEKDSLIRQRLHENLTEENIQTEIKYFSMNKFTTNYERTYGWAWLLKLTEELYTWDDPDAQKWLKNLQPLADIIVEKYKIYLPKLTYPIRVGEHSNTAFGLTFAWDYAQTVKETALLELIEKRAKEFYLSDKNCPITWEPSGYDFLSPCLEEADLMRRILPQSEFEPWLADFLQNVELTPATVSDRTDGKLVHLDGLNFSRAWCLYGIANQYPEYENMKAIADQHLAFSLSNIVDGDYAGEHWLGSFALYALDQQ